MSFTRRIFQVLTLALLMLTVLDEDARTTTGGFLQNGYVYMAGGANTPVPLERPPFLGLADLDDCLRGSARIEGDDAYAAFCADLATFAVKSRASGAGRKRMAMTHTTVPAAPKSLPSLKRADAETVDCLVDARGVPAHRAESIWMRAADDAGDESGTWSGRPSRLVSVPQRCRVESPSEGTVLYAGFFKGYLGVVIIETAKKERITVAGLGRVSVKREDRIVLGGEIGETSERLAPALAGAAQGKGGAALLYVTDGGASGPAS
jgi:hypothetical protein